MSDDNPHSERLKHAKKMGLNDPSPYGRAMAKIAALEEHDKALEPTLRTIDDLVTMAEVDDVSLDELSLIDLNETYKEGEKRKKDGGRPALLARLKEEGIEKLSTRQKLASTFVKAKRDGKLRLRPAKAADADAPSSEATGPAAAATQPASATAGATTDAAATATAASGSGDGSAGDGSTSGAAGGAAAPPSAPPAAAPSATRPVEEKLAAGQSVKLIALLSRPDLNGPSAIAHLL